MRAATIRRMIVFGVCAVGVGCLYLAPSMARSSAPAQGQPSGDERTSHPVRASIAAASSRVQVPAPAPAGQPQDPAGTGEPGRTASDAGAREGISHNGLRPARGATASDPRDRRDVDPPAAVTEVSTAKVTPTEFSVGWSPTQDNVGVVGYRLWLNGFAVATTPETRATVRWFPGDEGEHVIQVTALDAAGNESEASPVLIVARPSPAHAGATLAAAATPSVTATPQPSGSESTGQAPEAGATPSRQAPAAPDRTPSADPTNTAPAEPHRTIAARPQGMIAAKPQGMIQAKPQGTSQAEPS